jgi:methanogenic corrinoid protein MtbC1
LKSTFSTAELAKLFKINESTVKRWSDSGDLKCEKTRGGHRRYTVGSVMTFIQQNKLSTPLLFADSIDNEDLRVHIIAGNIHKLVPILKKEMLTGNVRGALDIVRIAFAAKPSFIGLCSNLLFSALHEIGEEWQANKISVDQEHLSTNTIKEALTLFQNDMYHKTPNGLTALCASSEGDYHDFALRCIGYYLETEGWRVIFLGQSTPADSIVYAITTNKPNLVVISVTAISNTFQFLKEMNTKISPAVHIAGAQLAIGGENIKAQFINTIKADHLCDTIEDFERIVQNENYSQQINQ